MSGEWWTGRTIDDDLRAQVPELFVMMITSARDLDQLARMHTEGGPLILGGPASRGGRDPRPPSRAWEDCKQEFRRLVCTEDGRYKDLRRTLGTLSAASGGVLVAAILQEFSPFVSADSTQLRGLVALGVAALIELGRAAFCPAAV